LSSPQGFQQEFHVGQHLEQISNINRVTIHPPCDQTNLFCLGRRWKGKQKMAPRKHAMPKNCRIRMYFNKKMPIPMITGLTQKSFLAPSSSPQRLRGPLAGH